MNLCSQLFRHLAKFIVCLRGGGGGGVEGNHLQEIT